ncbi:hypothetical protein RQK77_02315 [Escherichia coli]
MKRLILLSVMVATLPPYAISAEDISPNLFRESPVLSWVILFIQQCRMLVTACRGTGSQTQILFGLTVLRKQLPECHSALDLLASMLWALNQQCWRKGKRIRLGGFPWNVNASQVRP